MTSSRAIFTIIVGIRLAVSAAAADSRWGWDGGCPACPEHTSKIKLIDMAWVRVPCQGSMVYTSKTASGNWTQIDRDVNGWQKLGVKVILSTPFHPPGLSDDEILPWLVEFNRQCLNRYGSKIVGIEPANEPWIDCENAANSNSWAYQYARLGASHTNGSGYFWLNGVGSGTNSLTTAAVRWYGKLRELHLLVQSMAKPFGVKVYGPHWQTERYTSETRIAALLGVLDGIDVFTFGTSAKASAEGPNGWATWIDEILPWIGLKPWACTEFHLWHQPRGMPDTNLAVQVRAGMKRWRSRGVQCVIVHMGYGDWDGVTTNDPTAGLSMSGYIHGHTSKSLRALQVELAVKP